MFNLAVSAVLFATAAALAQNTPASPPTPAPRATPAPQPSPSPSPSADNMEPPPGFIAAAQAFGNCVGTKGQSAPANVAPEIAARQALAACATERAALEGGFENWVASPSFPAAGRTEARTQFKAQMDGLEAQIASKFREARAAAPMPGATPTPGATAAPGPTPVR